MPILDGGGGNDCIITFDQGPNYQITGGEGNDRIVANLPSSAADQPDEFFDAICAGKFKDYRAAQAQIEILGTKVKFKEPTNYGIPIVTLTVVVMIASLCLVLIARRWKS
ncbi:MAG: hypothetical protein V4530_13005 [Pseudomonadota bacterium]